MLTSTTEPSLSRRRAHASGWRSTRRRPRGKAGWLLLPAGIILAAAIAYPVLWAVGQSFFSDSISGNRLFIGFGNYVTALWGSDAHNFWTSVRTTILFTVVPGIFELVIGVLMALIMHTIVRGRGIARAMILVPWAIPTAVAAVLWRWMLQPNGIINSVLGIHVIWTAGSVAPAIAIMMIDIWKTAPFIALLVLAGLQTIPVEVMEAARVDGAGAWQRFWRITLPMAWPAIVVALVFRVLDLLRMYDVPAILTGGANNTDTLSLFTFQNAISQVKTGYGSALSTMTFILIFAVALLLIRVLGARLVTVED